MIEKILKEINRLKKELDGYSASEALDYIEAYINTLPEESKCIYNRTLEEKKKFCKYCSATCDVRIEEEPVSENLEDAAYHFCMDEYGNPKESLFEFDQRCFVAGAEWQKQKMMNDVFIDDYIVHDGRIELEGDPLPSVDPIILLPYPEFKPNDKVKIIIIKE